ncbi:phosphatase PAP2 family protein [Pyruvatibacter sp.]|uniref:phosphatase PAP2 family protein n=1 Tax=Pyruvatibacter sp. TaxID=1981328 RepID=UPI0032ED4B21
MDAFLYSMEWVLPLRSEWATPIAKGFTWLGYAPFFLIFLPIGYWLWDRAMFTRLTALVAITAVVNGWFKDLWQDPRPPAEIQLDGQVTGSPGRPSGHTQVAVVMWLWLAYEVRRPWMWGVCIVLAVGVSFSRLYLGVHDVDDVLTGTALALLTLALFAWLVSPSNSLVMALRRAPVAQLILVFALVPLIAALWPTAVEAADRATHTGSGPILSVMFMLAGWLAGAALDTRLAPDRARSAWWQMVIMAVAGIVVLFVLRDAIEAAGTSLGLSDDVTGWVGGTILGFYMTGLAPIAFRAARLMR